MLKQAQLQYSLNSSVSNIKFKEGEGGRTSTRHNQGRASQQQLANILAQNNGQQTYHAPQHSQQFNTHSAHYKGLAEHSDSMARQHMPVGLLNKTQSFLSAAAVNSGSGGNHSSQ